jgi:hypothetical protein
MASMTTRAGHKRWLIVTAIVIGSFGPIFALATRASTSRGRRWTLDLLNFPLDDAEQYDSDTMRFLSALTGGFLFGWGVMVLGLRAWLFDVSPEGVRRTVVVSMCSWFVLDSIGSVAAGAAPNVVGNIAVLLLGVGPLWRPASDGTAA